MVTWSDGIRYEQNLVQFKYSFVEYEQKNVTLSPILQEEAKLSVLQY